MSEKMREEFDEWTMQYGFDDGEHMWQAWQASRAALVVELPDAMGYPLAYHEAISDVEAALDDAGVNYK